MPPQYPKSKGAFQLAACFSDQAVASITRPSALRFRGRAFAPHDGCLSNRRRTLSVDRSTQLASDFNHAFPIRFGVYLRRIHVGMPKDRLCRFQAERRANLGRWPSGSISWSLRSNICMNPAWRLHLSRICLKLNARHFTLGEYLEIRLTFPKELSTFRHGVSHERESATRSLVCF